MRTERTQANADQTDECATLNLNLHLNNERVEPVAIDVSMMLAASSFVRPIGNLTDPRAAIAFDRVATAYCNGARLLLPLPKQTSCADPFFLDLWRRSGDINVIPNLELTDQFFEETTNRFEDGFRAFVEGSADEVAQWVAFHFTNDVVENHLGRSDIESILRAAATARRLVDRNAFPTLLYEINTLRHKGFREPARYEWLIGGNRLRSLHDLVVAYAISVSVRGFSYASGLSLLDPKPIYRHHWIRNPAFRYGMAVDALRIAENDPCGWIPWGAILTKVFDPVAPLIRRDFELIITVMLELRRISSELRKKLAAIQYVPHSSRLTDQEEVLLQVLRGFDISPKYADTTRSEKLAGWLRQLARSQFPAVSQSIELISSNFQPIWARNVESGFRMEFKRDTFWDVFDDPGVGTALKKMNAARIGLGKG